MFAASTPIRVIGLTGRAGCGKSTVASYLVDQYQFRRQRMSGPLKDMLRAIGLTDRHIEGDLKEVSCDLLCGKTPRYAMQTLGTEWRNLIGVKLWSNIWLDRARNRPAHVCLVTEDVRFPHEVEAIRDVGGVIFKIVRPGNALNVGQHPSESYDLPFDLLISNDGNLNRLFSQVDRVMREAVLAEAA